MTFKAIFKTKKAQTQLSQKIQNLDVLTKFRIWMLSLSSSYLKSRRIPLTPKIFPFQLVRRRYLRSGPCLEVIVDITRVPVQFLQVFLSLQKQGITTSVYPLYVFSTAKAKEHRFGQLYTPRDIYAKGNGVFWSI